MASSDAKRDLDRFRINLQKALAQLTNSANLKLLGEDQRQIIQTRTRLGYGVPKDLEGKVKFAPLALSTIESRKRTRKKGGLSELTSLKKSNLTVTGELINDLKSVISGSTVTIQHTKFRNERIGGFHQEGNPKLPQRRYLGLAKQDLKQIKALLTDRFNDILNKIIK